MTDEPPQASRSAKTTNEAMTAKCAWIGCTATTERPALDGWTHLTDGIKDAGLYYCPAHAAALEAILREGELDEPEDDAPLSYIW